MSSQLDAATMLSVDEAPHRPSKPKRRTRLDLAHYKLDAAVLDAYGWPHDVSDEELLERLLALNRARAEKIRRE